MVTVRAKDLHTYELSWDTDDPVTDLFYAHVQYFVVNAYTSYVGNNGTIPYYKPSYPRRGWSTFDKHTYRLHNMSLCS